MSKLNVLVSINSYEDPASTNNANLNHFKWTRQIVNGDATEPQSFQTQALPGSPTTVFSGTIPLTQDGTTAFELNYKSNALYTLKHDSGLFSGFRQDREIEGANDTEVTVSVSGSAVTFTNTAGTAWDLSSVVVGDEAKISSTFNSLNLGTFKVLAKTTDSFTIENQFGVAQTVTLTAGTDILIQSAAGVQVGDKVSLGSAFGSAEGIYLVKEVWPDMVDISSTKTLPAMTVTANIAAFSKSKKMVYIESQGEINLVINGTQNLKLQAGFIGSPAISLISQTVYSMTVQPVGIDPVLIFVASVE